MSKLNIDMIREIKNNHPAVPEPFLNESKLLDVEEDCRKAFLSSRTGRLGAFGKAFHSFIEAPSGDLVSRPTRARGLKQECGPVSPLPKDVAPHAGAWIETTWRSPDRRSGCVAPHAGARIEISRPEVANRPPKSRPTWACGFAGGDMAGV